MKKTVLALLVCMTACYAHAQTKVFKEVGEDISSQMKIIRQDNALVGYLVFTQLEKASADSFNYKITIMDENLNDIGTVSFREIKLILQSVSFESDVLCLAYVKSNIVGTVFDNKKDYKAALHNGTTYIFTQFLSLSGKIIKTNSIEADITHSEEYVSRKKVVGTGQLKEAIQLKNIPQKGFALFYGDDTKKNLVIYNPAGKQTWQTVVSENAQGFDLLTSGQDVYILTKKQHEMLEGGFELLSYGLKDSSTYSKIKLRDKKDNQLKVLTFDNDPITGKPYLSGYIISHRRGNSFLSSRDISAGTYEGVFSISLNGHEKSDIKEVYSYWSDGSKPAISQKGYFWDKHVHARFESSFKDFQGNTWFVGSSFSKSPKWGSIAWSVVTAPLFLPPPFILMFGTSKTKIKSGLLLKMDAKGQLSADNSIPGDKGRFFRSRWPLYMKDPRSYYTVTNADTKTDYVILNDEKNIFIYNVNQTKLVRTIPHKDGNIRTYVFPAKEGHVMVSEYNKKEKYTRYSIEAL